MVELVEENVSKVTITSSRWDVTIEIEKNGEVKKFVASADSALTWGDGIWFGDAEEHKEDLEGIV